MAGKPELLQFDLFICLHCGAIKGQRSHDYSLGALDRRSLECCGAVMVPLGADVDTVSDTGWPNGEAVKFTARVEG